MLVAVGLIDPDAPSVTPDGKRIVVPYSVDEYSPAGTQRIELRVYNRAGALVDTRVVVDVADPDGAPIVAKRKRAAQRYVAKLHLRALKQTTAAPVTFGNDGTLTVSPRRHAPITRTGWRVTPSTEQQRAIDAELALGGVGCFNPAELGDVWYDAKARVAVVEINFHGNDSCWEGDSDVVVITW